MKQLQPFLKIILLLLLPVAATTTIVLRNYKYQRDTDKELVLRLALSGLTNIADKHKSSDLGKQADVALSKLKNGVVDTEPLLMRARLGLNESALQIICFDEDRDLRGLRIREEHIDPNGTTTILSEDYPVFVFGLKSFILETPRFPVQIRDKDQRKDEYRWLQYSNSCLDNLVHWYLDQGRQVSGGFEDAEPPKIGVPPVYISVPEPNSVHVFVSVYDRAGHETKRIELLNNLSNKRNQSLNSLLTTRPQLTLTTK